MVSGPRQSSELFLAASNMGDPLVSLEKLAEYRDLMTPSLDKTIEVCTAHTA